MRNQKIIGLILFTFLFSCKNKEIPMIVVTDNEEYNIGFHKLSQYEDYEGAILHFSKALKGKTEIENSYRFRGVAKLELGDYRGAIADFNNAIDQHTKRDIIYEGDLGGYYLDRGIAKAKLGSTMDAINDIDYSIELYPLGGKYYKLALLKFKLGDKEGACLDLSRAGELGHKMAFETIRARCK